MKDRFTGETGLGGLGAWSDAPHGPALDPRTRLMAVRRSLAFLFAVLLISLGGATAAHAQVVDVSVDPDTPAPGATVTVTVTGAASGQPVVVRLATEEASGTTDATGGATVLIAAPNVPGEALGTVRVGLVDFPIRVVVQTVGDTTTTTTGTTTTSTTTTTLPPPPTTPPVTGLDDTATLVGLGAVLMAVGLGFMTMARRPSAALGSRGSVTSYRIVGGRRNGRSTHRR
jgi:hypothetical protein